ncbi:MAG: AAA family ATPase [Clostridiales bacterium]|nr:AAA family ATPase [Clostridiales bacterium]MCF8021940.1 AAA family ATPase [Clostridiales bacterium]
MKIAISGKGGVGKTTITSILAKQLAEKHSTVFAMDADPDACLASALGIPEEKALNIKPVVEMRDLIRNRTGAGSFYVLNPKLDDAVEDYCYKHGNIWFLRMGDVKKGGSECYCRENTFLNALVSSLLLERDEAVLMDMGAGIEHLTRGTARGVDLILVVIEPNKNSINTAHRVQQLAEDLSIKNVKVIANKINGDKQKQFIEDNFNDNDILGIIKYNENIWESSLESSLPNELGEDTIEQINNICSKIEAEINNNEKKY